MKTKTEKIADFVAKKKVGKLTKLALDKDEEVAVAALEGLGEVGGEEADEFLQNLIRDPSPAIRLGVAKAFQKTGNDHVSEALRHQMLVETDPKLKAEFEKAMDFCRDRRQG